MADPDEKPPSSEVSSIPSTPLSSKDAILLQGFHWESPNAEGGWWGFVQNKANDLKDLGVTDVWLPPPTQCVDRNGYMPGELYNLEASKYGNEANLKGLINALHGVGLKVVADIVINHRCGSRQDDQGRWTIFEGGTSDDKLDWGPWAIVASDKPYNGDGAKDTGADYDAAPDIDHTNPRVQEGLIKWLLWLKQEIGFDGWRFDFVKGYAPEFVSLYCQRTQPSFAVGEFWPDMKYTDGKFDADQNESRTKIVDWVNGAGQQCFAFDFTTKAVLNEACKNGEFWRLKDAEGRSPGVIGLLPALSVTFIDNHDTGSTQKIMPFISERVLQGYAYILTHPGIPCIFWDHVFNWGLQWRIKELVNIRKRNGINAESTIDILAAESDIYVARIGNNIVLKLGPRYEMGDLLPDSKEFQFVTYGNDWAIWERIK